MGITPPWANSRKMITMNFFFILIVATITQGIFLVFALLTSKHNNKIANYLLSGLIVLFSYYALVKILSNNNDIFHYPHLIRTYRPIFILVCAVIYFCNYSAESPKKSKKRLDKVFL